jgi:hypothetical protein
MERRILRDLPHFSTTCLGSRVLTAHRSFDEESAMAHLRYKKLREVFPADDPLSNLAFRLAIVREDLAIEGLLILEESLPDVDRGDILCRRGYLMRRHILTIHTATDIFRQEGALIERIITSPVDDQERLIGRNLNIARRALNKHWDKLSKWRNTLGGHIDKDLVARLLRDMGDLRGWIELDPDPTRARSKNHFWRLPYGIFNLALLPEGFDLNDDEAGNRFFSESGKTMVGLFKILLPAIDSILRHQIYRMRAWE